MTKCPRCANTKENYLQEGMNRCKVCFICWPIEEPATPKDNPTLGQIVHFGNSPLLSGSDNARCKICNFTAQLWSHGIPFCSIACRDRHNPEATKRQRILTNKLTKEAEKNMQKFYTKVIVDLGSFFDASNQIWVINTPAFEAMGFKIETGEEK